MHLQPGDQVSENQDGGVASWVGCEANSPVDGKVSSATNGEADDRTNGGVGS